MMKKSNKACKWDQNRIKPLLHQTSRSSPPHLPVNTISCAFGVCVHTHVPEILKGSVYMLLTYWNIVCNVGFQSVSLICVNLSLTFTNPCIYSLFLFQYHFSFLTNTFEQEIQWPKHTQTKHGSLGVFTLFCWDRLFKAFKLTLYLRNILGYKWIDLL